ncbi:serine dehydratase-like isoform X3 [Lithobates pipiens]
MNSQDEVPFHIVSPLKESPALSRKAGTQVLIKLENIQPVGSFKIRGIGHFCQKLAKEGCKKFVCSSGGNAGLAAAYACNKLGLPATIVVPEQTLNHVIQRLKDLGAEVVVTGKVWDDADAHAHRLAEAPGSVYISPFNHPLLCIAKCLGAKTVCDRALECARKYKVISVVVDDREAVQAIEMFLDDELMLVEAACGAALSAVYSGHIQRLQQEGKLQQLQGPLIMIVCGGSAISLSELQNFKSQLGMV